MKCGPEPEVFPDSEKGKDRVGRLARSGRGVRGVRLGGLLEGLL